MGLCDEENMSVTYGNLDLEKYWDISCILLYDEEKMSVSYGVNH